MTTARRPLFVRFPALAEIPHVALGTSPTPVVAAPALAAQLWIKRDDLFADPLGGNKSRALEFLLGGVSRGDAIITVGSAGSTHALSVATYGARLGASVHVGRWRQEMNDQARLVSRRIESTATRAPLFRTPIGAYLWAGVRRARDGRWIAAGGSTALGILGHVNAGLELVDQVDAGLLPLPTTVVAPLGTGGTAAGLALAFAIAERPIAVLGVRVVPRIVARIGRVRRLADAAAHLIERATGARVPRPRANAIAIAHEAFGGAYGRETEAAREAARRMQATAGIMLDATYSAKALVSALALAERAPTVFWLTFDSRSLDGHDTTP